MEGKENQNDVLSIDSISQWPEDPTGCMVKVMRSYPSDYGFDFLSPSSTTAAWRTVEETVPAKTWRSGGSINVMYERGLIITYPLENCPVVELDGKKLIKYGE